MWGNEARYSARMYAPILLILLLQGGGGKIDTKLADKPLAPHAPLGRGGGGGVEEGQSRGGTISLILPIFPRASGARLQD